MGSRQKDVYQQLSERLEEDLDSFPGQYLPPVRARLASRMLSDIGLYGRNVLELRNCSTPEPQISIHTIV